jgi:hypothetical protein
MSHDEFPASARFIRHVSDFVALQSHFRRRFNLSPSQWLTLYGAFLSVHYEQGHWICAEFSTSDIVRTSLTSRETVRRSVNRLLSKNLFIRQKRRYVLSPQAIAEMRALLDQPSPRHGQDRRTMMIGRAPRGHDKGLGDQQGLGQAN